MITYTNCTQLSSIAIIYSGLNIQRSDLWIRCSPRQMFTNKLACLVKDVFFQERGSCETRKGLEKETNVLGVGRGKTVPVFICSILFIVVVLAAAASVVFFPEAFFRFLEPAGKGNDCYADLPRAVMIFRGSALLLPCFVRLQKDIC